MYKAKRHPQFYRHLSGALIVGLGLCVLLWYYAGYWIENPTLTERQVFKAQWKKVTGGGVLVGLGSYLIIALPKPGRQGKKRQPRTLVRPDKGWSRR